MSEAWTESQKARTDIKIFVPKNKNPPGRTIAGNHTAREY